ncbi:PREDICTED: F-box/kelch-repeat protein At3g23880-like [Fragaria vesca subsp. vesca]|uniref:F-box/kelch-repeat protein At3g23880-like n=1 Tax=Fragaria vesca subsp. vesca TaxID=101020 RepID=UPI0002C2FCB0|nr:PREDICTED: F-box/kelch-repeat protein At3g23880-like [Fragaria vesca subsp. vesca]
MRRLQTAAYLPEELTVKVLERLPVKSLIRFTSVSKRWRFIILSDPEFAKSQFQIASQHQTFRHRALVSTSNETEIESHNLLSSSSPKLRCPFILPRTAVKLICSCNGLVCALLLPLKHFYIWNPSTGFFSKLPEPVGYPLKNRSLFICGFGYLSASDDYKLIAKLKDDMFGDGYDYDYYFDVVVVMLIFSSKANSWKRTEAPVGYHFNGAGILSNEVVHWMDKRNDMAIVAFDLAEEEFRGMPLPVVDGGELGFLRAYGDSLCVFDLAKVCTSCSIDMWVMKEYGVDDSWMKLFKLKISNQPENIKGLRPNLVLETTTFLQKRTVDSDGRSVIEVIRSGHTKEELHSFVLSMNAKFMEMIEYEETLLRLG